MTKPSIVVSVALAAVADVDPLDLATEFEITLYDHVDPEALDTIVGDERPGRTAVTFTIDDYLIRFAGDELVVRATDG